jgi:hypothetical protein
MRQNPSTPLESKEALLARVYAFILSLSDPPIKDTPGSEHFSEDTEPEEETTAKDACAQ